MTSAEAPPINEVSPAAVDPSLPMKEAAGGCIMPLQHPRGQTCARHTLSFIPISPISVSLHQSISNNRRHTALGCGSLGSPISHKNQFRVAGMINRSLMEHCHKNLQSSPMSASSYSTAQSSDFESSPMGRVADAPRVRNTFEQPPSVILSPQFSARMAKALHTMKTCTEASAFRSAPNSPAKLHCGVFSCYAESPFCSLRKSTPSFIRPDLGALGVDSDPCIDEEMVPEEVHTLLAQMNSSSLAVNECENQLRLVRQLIAHLDSDWKSTRERLMSSIGANHIQRADPFYTKLREIGHRKDFCTKLAQKYAHLSTLSDQINMKEAKSEREMRWLQMRVEKSNRLKIAIEKQMATSTETVAKLQQELSAHGQEHAISVKKAESFFLGYSTYLDNRKKAMLEQKEVEEKVTENKDLYKAAMDGLESLSRQIHQERGTLANARKPVL